MAIDTFGLDDEDDPENTLLEITFISGDSIMLSVIDKRDKKEISVISVSYSDLLGGILNLRQPIEEVKAK